MKSKPIINYESYLIYENGDVKNLNTNKIIKLMVDLFLNIFN